MTLDLALCILGMCVVSAGPRIAPMLLLSSRTLPRIVYRWLAFVPPSVLAALLAPELFVRNHTLVLRPDNLYLVVAVPTLLVAWKSKSLFITLAVGMGLVALSRFLLPLFWI